MSQWNNSYAYNNQHQGANNWSGDMNNQYVNQAYYNRSEGGPQYISFNEFLNQMQTNTAATNNATSFNNVQHDSFQARQYNYQNVQSTSQTQPGNYNYQAVPLSSEVNTYQPTAPTQYNHLPESNSYTNQMILNSNLTATATEFVPKSVSLPLTSTQNIPEATNSQNVANETQSNFMKKPLGSSSDKNWRERPLSSHTSEVKEKHAENGDSHENSGGHSNNSRNRDTYRNNEGNNKQYESKNQEFRNKGYESAGPSQDPNYSNTELDNLNELSDRKISRRNYDRNQDSNNRNPDSYYRNQDPYSRNQDPYSRNQDSYSRNQEASSRNQDSSSRNQEASSRNQDSSSRNQEANNRNQDSSSRNQEANNRNQDSYSLNPDSYGRSQDSYSRNQESTNQNTGSYGQNENSNSHNQESNNRNPDSNSRNQESHSRNYDNSRNSSRYYESNNRSQEFTRNQELSNRNQDSRSYESNNRNEKRNQPKNTSKFKGKDSDNRTFYNSSMPKEQENRGGKGEGSGRNRNWGSQRLRGADRNTVEDEQYTSTYTSHKEERIEKERAPRVQNAATASPRFKSKQGDQVNNEMTQRERLGEQLDKGTLECLVCCDRVKQTDPVWSCSNCYHVLHLRCIRKWAMSSIIEGKWRCPACQNSNDAVPTEYRCMCGAVRAPEYSRGAAGAHTCGRSCRRPRACPHPCTLLCHPGPCPPCQATVTRQCGCGVETRSILCSSKLAQVCGRVCNRSLECKVHVCAKECHEGTCDSCEETLEQVCHCPAGQMRMVACTCDAGAAWSCGGACGRVLACGAHVCRAPCHAPPCEPCALLPTAVRACPCGKMKLETEARKSCTDPIPLCGNICAKPLSCGPAGDKHFCKLDCHEGPCPVCPDKTLVQCRCGHSSREVPCKELPQMIDNVLCQKKCNKKLSCGRHRCRAACCAGGAHRCAVPCGRSLACGTHRCEDSCHTGHCAPCHHVSFSELTCECGAQVLLPPVRCGTRPPACEAPCRRTRSCGHPPHHNCHSGECPPCVVLTTKRCYGEHEERKTIPCSQEEFSCGLPCGKPLPCGKHTCIKTCHKGPCDTGKCAQPCMEKRPSCGHPCAAPCHAGSGGSCPSAVPCRRIVRAACLCGRRHADRTCSDNARDLTKMMSTLAATKMQEGGSVDLSEVQRPANMLKTLECDDECRVEARTRQLALALQIRNPDVSAKLAPRYNDNLRATAAKEPAFAQQIHDALTDLVQRAKKSKQKTRSHSFPSMNWQKRQFIHELSEHFGCESVAYDAEPNRNVVATADREKSWLPAMSVLEVLAREAGKRRVPGPVLRAPPPSAASATSRSLAHNNTSKSSGSGWATLTSTNAWAARSQPKTAIQPKPASQPAQPKIDYFDNPPDN